MARLTVISIILLCCSTAAQSDCSYVDIKSGLAFPTETCIYRTIHGYTNSSMLLHCTNTGIEMHEFDNFNCDGKPSTKTPSMFAEWDYKCGANYFPNSCNNATLTHSCNSEKTQTTIITNKCFNVQNYSFIAECDSYNNGNVYRYNSLDCEGTRTTENLLHYFDNTTRYCNEIIWQCTPDMNDNISTVSANHSISTLIVIFITAVICSFCTIVCVCYYRKSKNLKRSIDNTKQESLVDNHYVAMGNVVPSAPKMSSIGNEEDSKVYYESLSWQNPEGPDLNRFETNGVEGGGVIDLLDNEEYREVVCFFNEKVCIDDSEDTRKYIKIFVMNGYDTAYKINKITHQELIDIGIDKLVHRRKILEKAAEMLPITNQ